jgi:hypothetical protein
MNKIKCNINDPIRTHWDHLYDIVTSKIPQLNIDLTSNVKFNSKNYSFLIKYLEELKYEVRKNKHNLNKKASSRKLNSLLKIFRWIKENIKKPFKMLVFGLMIRILPLKLKSKPSSELRIKNG